MCIRNEINFLNELRRRKRPIIVWKYVLLDAKTGLAQSQRRHDGVDQVVWKKGTIVTPIPKRRLKIVRPGRDSGAGLYFYLSKDSIPSFIGLNDPSHPVIKASVRPEDIIAASAAYTPQLVARAAKVLEAPNPDPIQQRIKWLREKLQKANDQLKVRRDTMKEWLDEEEMLLESKRHIEDEIKELKGNKS